MKNYKIRVNNEAESREAQDLFEQLGFTWAGDNPENGDWYSHLYTEKSSCCHLPIYVWNGLGDKFQEITLPQLRDLVAQSKNEQCLISGADALRALADGEEVEYSVVGQNEWHDNILNITPYYFVGNGVGQFDFRLKPHTIKVELEIPAPFKPKVGDEIWFLNPDYGCGYADGDYDPEESVIQFGAWRTEEEIQQVVAALRRGIKA